MKKSTYISTVKVNDHRNPGQIISLDVHQVEGGMIGIEPSYIEEVANYITNPYEDCQVVMLADPQNGDSEPDPPLDEDELVGFMRIITAIDKGITQIEGDRSKFMSGLSKLSGLTTDRIEVLLGLAKETLEGIELDRFIKVLKPSDEGIK